MTESAKSVPFVASREQLVTIKGIRSGLLFVLADDAVYADVLEELKQKLTGTHQHLLSGAVVNVYIDCGTRELSQEEKDQLRAVFATHENLVLDGFEGPPPTREMTEKVSYVFKGTLRSGQLIEHDGDVIIIGDVNPGAQIVATGDIFIMGHLRGSAHAGAQGDVQAVVAAAYFEPLQVRIAEVVRRSPETYDRPAEMEFAYLDGEQMAVEKMAVFTYHRQRRHGSRAVI